VRHMTEEAIHLDTGLSRRAAANMPPAKGLYPGFRRHILCCGIGNGIPTAVPSQAILPCTGLFGLSYQTQASIRMDAVSGDKFGVMAGAAGLHCAYGCV